MKNTTYIILLILGLTASASSLAQVGINTSSPKSLLDINKSGTGNGNGILIPTIDAFPLINPGADQDGMLVFLRTPTTNYKKGHYYWDNNDSIWTYFAGEWVDGYNSNLDNLTYLKQAYGKLGTNVVILDNGRMGMGTDDPDESIEIKLPGDNDIQISSNESQPNAPNIIYYTKGGTFSSPTFLTNNKPITSIAGSAWSGTGESDILGSVTSYADGNHSSGNLPTKFNISVTGSGDDDENDNGVEMTIKATGNVGIGNENPSAYLHVKAGTATPNSAPLKFNAGTNLSTPESGTIEFDGSHLYVTDNSNSRQILMKGLQATANLDFLVIPLKSALELTVTVPGAAIGSSCNCTPQGSIENGLKWSCYVSAANTARIRLSNITNTLIDPAMKTWKVTVIE